MHNYDTPQPVAEGRDFCTKKSRPILFKGAMVRAVLNTKPDHTAINPQKPIKWQTRRVIKPSSNPKVPPLEMEPWVVNGEREVDNNGCPCWAGAHPDYPTGQKWFSCPYGKQGDFLWVRETMEVTGVASGGKGTETAITVKYCADDSSSGVLLYPSRLKGKPQVGKKLSYGGYQEASRLTLEVLNVRVERLQDISCTDIRAEGIAVYQGDEIIEPVSATDQAIYLDQWIRLWDGINAGRGMGWNINPWVWVIEFKRVWR